MHLRKATVPPLCLSFGVQSEVRLKLPVISKALTCRIGHTLLLTSVCSLLSSTPFEHNGRNVALMPSNYDWNVYKTVAIIKITVGTVIMCILSVATFCCAVQRIKSSKAKFWAVKQTCCAVSTHVNSADAHRCRPSEVTDAAHPACRLVHWND